MGLFSKYCEICDRKIERGNDIVRFGKHFDSEEHAEQYKREREQYLREEERPQTEKESQKRSSRCC